MESEQGEHPRGAFSIIIALSPPPLHSMNETPHEAATHAAIEARERVEGRARRRAHRACLAAEAHHSEQLKAEAAEGWQAVGGTEKDALSAADCARAFEKLGLRGVDVRGRLPGAPSLLRELYLGGGTYTLADFAAAYSLRMMDYDGAVCTLCGSWESTDPTRSGFECESIATGLCICSVFAEFASAASDAGAAPASTHAAVHVACLPEAVLAVLCFRAGIDPRLRVDELKVCERAAHTEWRAAASRIAELAASKLPTERVSVGQAQEAIETAMIESLDGAGSMGRPDVSE